MRYDVIVIGSGVSGMTAGVILAREGLRVAVLEQHTIPGGLMQSFRRRSLLFPTGVHRLGALGEGQPLRRYFAYLKVLDRLRLSPMDPDGFEEFCFPGFRLAVPEGHAAFRERLLEAFPGERPAVDAYFAAMAAAARKFGLYNLSGERGVGEVDGSRSLSAFLGEAGCGRRLFSVLTAANPLYGLAPSHCPADLHFIVMDSFLRGSRRVDEVGAPMAAAFAESLREQGGELRCGARVTEVVVEEGHARGVRLAEGDTLLADTVIHTGHPGALLSLCPEKAFRPVYRRRLAEAENTPGMFGVALQWSAADCPLIARDSYLYDSAETDRHYDAGRPFTSWPDMIYCSALPGGEENRRSVTAIGAFPGGAFDRWRGVPSRERGEEYARLKEALADRVIAAMTERWPEMAGRITALDTYSPLTFEDYTLAPGGTAYGIHKGVEVFRQNMFLPMTRVRGLMLAGQSILMPGVMGALISGVYACSLLLGEEYLMGRIMGETR